MCKVTHASGWIMQVHSQMDDSLHTCYQTKDKKRNEMTTNDLPPQLVLQQMIQGFQVTQCIYVAAKLGIADQLKEGPRTSEELAQATGTHAPSLYRVLHLLTAVDLLTEAEAHSFALTPLGAYLQTSVPGSMHETALFYCDTLFWSNKRCLSRGMTVPGK